jgi:SHS2 domain-containing protein
MYKLLEHTADIGIEVKAEGWAELFAEAARGLTALLYDPSLVKEDITQEWKVKVREGDAENLLVKWLSHILYEFEVNNFMPRRFEILSWSPLELSAKGIGEIFERNRHRLRLAVKGVTYHQLKIEQVDGKYQVKIFFDV